MANQFLALALFIVLLSFFIVLNSMSTYDEAKAKPVLNSISTAFNQDDQPIDLSESVAPDPINSVHQGDVLDNLKTLFTAQIASLDIRKNRLGTIMHVSMPLLQFEREILSPTAKIPDGIGGGVIGEEFLPVLVSLLRAENTAPYCMDMVLNIEANPATQKNNAPDTLTKNIQKVSTYTQTLERSGLPNRLMTAGLGKGDPKTIELYFRRHEPFSPVNAVEPSNAQTAEEALP